MIEYFGSQQEIVCPGWLCAAIVDANLTVSCAKKIHILQQCSAHYALIEQLMWTYSLCLAGDCCDSAKGVTEFLRNTTLLKKISAVVVDLRIQLKAVVQRTVV